MADAPTLPLRVPEGLRWSAATAAFQVEGARTADGRGRSIWDDFVDTPGNVRDGSTAEPGPDSFHRNREDVALLRDLGVDRYRFSISWVRVQPDGRGPASPAGLAYYDRLVDDLLAEGIVPFPTLYHWDLPSGLEAEGGWLSRDTAERFAAYAEHVAAALGDRVKHWYTINEPVSTSLQGYAVGVLAPGRQLLFDSLPTVHHQLLAHGLAAAALRARGADAVGIVNNHTWVYPASDSESDQTAAHLYDLVHNRLFAEPVLTGAYPDLAPLGAEMPVQAGDLEVIASASDFYGVNYYNPTTIAAAPDGAPVPFVPVPTAGAEHTGFGELWPIDPAALTAFLVDAKQRYGDDLPPIIVGENGASFPEPDRVDGPLEDRQRIDYLAGHVSAVADAVAQGVDVEEYTVWSLLDNFEWADGFTQRFGIVHVDQETSKRTPKTSYGWYRDLIASTR
ncbi:GH1 family beta-glucosidase [Microbacterium aerolatum]|uniref:Beta-glucosidase n=1 Tax=Microbacterium aerolatum TaxID=153731 RepID=A0A511AHI4_9MICO|nr:GH1 family beta-glucosidase [Microbacterium aerolatum]GEK87640.1 beta-glucosidase [Microbacterium aerolatum]GGB25425.1 beta-glucosidase [Microbacterium aerolatum]